MKKMSDRPPIVPFLLAFIGLIAVALGLAAFSPAPEAARDGASADDQRSSARQAAGAGPADRSVTGAVR